MQTKMCISCKSVCGNRLLLTVSSTQSIVQRACVGTERERGTSKGKISSTIRGTHRVSSRGLQRRPAGVQVDTVVALHEPQQLPCIGQCQHCLQSCTRSLSKLHSWEHCSNIQRKTQPCMLYAIVARSIAAAAAQNSMHGSGVCPLNALCNLA